jgi:hypothetical protein
MRHAVIHAETNIVVNVIVWDGVSKWTPPAGHYVVRHDHCNIGDRYDSVTNSFDVDKPADIG